MLEADVIIHVRDIAHDEIEAQKSDVLAVLAELGIESDGDRRMLDVFNKIDLLSPEERAGLRSRNGGPTAPIAISALTGEGIPDLLERLDRMLDTQSLTFELRLASEDGAGLPGPTPTGACSPAMRTRSAYASHCRLSRRTKAGFESGSATGLLRRKKQHRHLDR